MINTMGRASVLLGSWVESVKTVSINTFLRRFILLPENEQHKSQLVTPNSRIFFF